MSKIMQIISKNQPVTIRLTKAEVEALKNYCDDNLAIGIVEVTQSHSSGIGWNVYAQVENLPETRKDITDYDSW